MAVPNEDNWVYAWRFCLLLHCRTIGSFVGGRYKEVIILLLFIVTNSHSEIVIWVVDQIYYYNKARIMN